MRVLVIHSDGERPRQLAEGLEGELRKQGVSVDTWSAAAAPSVTTTAVYGLVVMVSTFSGLLRPQIPAEIEAILKRSTRLEGRDAMAVVPARLGSGKALQRLMALMEAQGMMVQDFWAAKNDQDVQETAHRVMHLLQRGGH